MQVNVSLNDEFSEGFISDTPVKEKSIAGLFSDCIVKEKGDKVIIRITKEQDELMRLPVRVDLKGKHFEVYAPLHFTDEQIQQWIDNTLVAKLES